ncbi:hypothetical protein I553_4494 [Mycobacterium xenopi 4042]|uniref:Uncharacterized protein n=1 Tax=Mycobacterium xenopi 4042 TaxID=1299334 RepID=X8AE82_MYCXE|nr:hypothetical protein I553_4494 [Mycobacterium xenopi 4042]
MCAAPRSSRCESGPAPDAAAVSDTAVTSYRLTTVTGWT